MPMVRLVPKCFRGPPDHPVDPPSEHPADQLPLTATAAAMEVAAGQAILKRNSLARDSSESKQACHRENVKKQQIEAEIPLVEGLILASVAAVAEATAAVLVSQDGENEARILARTLVEDNRIAGDADSRAAASISVGKIASAMQKRKQMEAIASSRKTEEAFHRHRLSRLKDNLKRVNLLSLKLSAKNKSTLAMAEIARMNAAVSASTASITARFEEKVNVRIMEAHEALGALNALELLEAGAGGELMNSVNMMTLTRSQLTGDT